jgi:hypothetical protein
MAIELCLRRSFFYDSSVSNNPEQTRMNRLLRIVFFCLAVLLAVYTALFANYLHVSGQPAFHAKITWLGIGGAIFLAMAGWRFSLQSKFKIFAVLMSLLAVELSLQAAAWLGVLPAVNAAQRVPFARVYWTSEGHGNGIRNRFGWYYPPFDLKASHKIAFIGDSQVEGLQVSSAQDQAADLQKLLKEKSPDWSVLSLGIHGSCSAQSIDVLEYAWRHFQPKEAIVVVSLCGADRTSPKLNIVPPEQYVYYDLDADGKLVLNPASAVGRKRLDEGLELNHRSLLFNLPFILYSHCMILQLADSLRDDYSIRRQQAQLAARANGASENGFDTVPFKVPQSPEVQRAFAVLLAELRQCQAICDRHGMKFRLLTIPEFPKAFYDSQHGRDWTVRIGDYDYFGPERMIAAWARTNGIPVVSVGEYIQRKKMDVEEIRSLYFTGGSGHLTEKGHALCAQAVYEGFYQNLSP